MKGLLSKLDSKDNLEREAAERQILSFVQAEQERNKQAREFEQILFAISESADGMMWIKDFDCKTGNHSYRFANKMLCDRFFGLEGVEHKQQLEFIKGETDIELLNRFRARTGLEHTYGKLCVSTDIHTRDMAIARKKLNKHTYPCLYLEMGIIGDEPFILKVKKQAVFRDEHDWCSTRGECIHGEDECGILGYCMNIGHAWDVTKNFKYEQIGLENYLKEGKAEKLSPGVFWLKPDKDFPMEELRKELGI